MRRNYDTDFDFKIDSGVQPLPPALLGPESNLFGFIDSINGVVVLHSKKDATFSLTLKLEQLRAFVPKVSVPRECHTNLVRV